MISNSGQTTCRLLSMYREGLFSFLCVILLRFPTTQAVVAIAPLPYDRARQITDPGIGKKKNIGAEGRKTRPSVNVEREEEYVGNTIMRFCVCH